MDNLPVNEKKFDVRIVLLVLGICLIICILFFLFQATRSFLFAQKTRTFQAVEQVDDSKFIPVNEIQSMIKPCLFQVIEACTESLNTHKALDENPEVQPEKNYGPEAKAETDVFEAIENSPNKSLAEYQVPLSPEELAEYFPERTFENNSLSTTVQTPIVIARVAMKYDVNQRILLLLMELLQRGKGPLFTNTQDFSTPYYTSAPGFFSQLVAVASELHVLKSKYVLLYQSSNPLPATLHFYDKDYSIKDSNPETLALVELLSQKIASKKEFERAIYVPKDFNKFEVEPTENFELLYKLIYSIDPR